MREREYNICSYRKTSSDIVDRSGWNIKRIYTNKSAKVYYPYAPEDVYYPYEREGEYLITKDSTKIDAIVSLCYDNKNTEYKKPSLDELEEALTELKYSSQARKLNPDDELANRFETLAYNNLKELINGYNRETEEKNVRNSLNCYKPVMQLPSVDIMTNFISEISVSIAKLKEEARYVTDIRFWEILQCVVNLESIMNNAIDLIEQIKEK